MELKRQRETFQRRLIRNPSGGAALSVDAWTIADHDTVIITSYDGTRAWSINLHKPGALFQPGMPAGNLPLHRPGPFARLYPGWDYTGRRYHGRIYFADNQSASFGLLSGDTASLPLSGAVTVACDPAFSSNRVVYAAGYAAGSGHLTVLSSGERRVGRHRRQPARRGEAQRNRHRRRRHFIRRQRCRYRHGALSEPHCRRAGLRERHPRSGR